MTLPNGVGNQSATRPAPERLNRKGVQTPSIEPARKQPLQPTGPLKLGMRFSGLGNVISSIPVPPKVQDAFLSTAKEGASAIVLPESSVIVGRSVASYKRDGWLELQERLPEEVTVAAIWLKGVDALQHVFEKQLKPRLFAQNNHLSSNIAWNKAWGKTTHVDLTPQEMFAKNQQEISALLKMKSARWVFSVGLALAGVGYVVPKLNQWKTNMVLQYLGRRKRNTEGSNVQFGDPSNAQSQPHTTQGQRTPLNTMLHRPFPLRQQSVNGFSAPVSQTSTQFPNHSTVFSSSNPFSNASGPIYPGVNQNSQMPGGPFQASPASNPTTQGKKGGVQFGGLPGGALVQSLGHWVEQTPFGSILVVDAGIAGGRGYVASKRSLFETAEVIVRDIGSLYFYILFAPHMMKALGAVTDGLAGTSINIQPKVAEQLHQEIAKRLGEPSKYTLDSLRTALNGGNDQLMRHEGFLKDEIRLASKDTFKTLLEKEAQVYVADTSKSSELTRQIMGYLTEKTGKPNGQVAPSQIQELLTALKEGLGAFKSVPLADRQNLSIAVKQAFRHTTGVTLERLSDDAIRQHANFKPIFKALGKGHPEEHSLLERIRRMAQVDGLDQSHSMLRRSMNAMQDTLKASPTMMAHGNKLADWIDQAVNRRLNLGELITEELESISSKLDKIKLAETERNHLASLLKTPSIQNLQTAKDTLQTIGNHPANKRFNLGVWKTKAVRALELSEQLGSLKQLLGQEAHADLAQAAQRTIRKFMAELTAKAPKGSSQQQLLQHYQQQMGHLLNGQGRLFSLAIQQEDDVLGQKVQELLKGGLRNDGRFLAKALDIVGQLETDSRKYTDPGKAAKMRTSIINYSDALLKKAENLGKGATLQEGLERFFKLNRNLHYGAWTLSLAGTMFCLGWLVPHAQNALTMRLTGKNKNPGIAHAEDASEKSMGSNSSSNSGTASGSGSPTTGGQKPSTPQQSPYQNGLPARNPYQTFSKPPGQPLYQNA